MSSALVDDAHAATAQLFDDAVMRNALADRWSESYVDKTGQVNESLGVGGTSKGLLA